MIKLTKLEGEISATSIGNAVFFVGKRLIERWQWGHEVVWTSVTKVTLTETSSTQNSATAISDTVQTTLPTLSSL